MTTLRIELPPKLVDLFSRPARHRIIKGGRGGGKTRGVAKMAGVDAFRLAQGGAEGIFLCSREHLNSLDESSLEELKVSIRSEPDLLPHFDIGERYIRTADRRVSFAFAGLRHNLDSIKSKARILRNWTDEAEAVSEAAWRKLLPTIREHGSENWVTYNPESSESATHKRFIADTPTSCIVTELNWRDNPWWNDVLNQERLDDKRLRPDTYDHVWEGAFLTRTDAQIFAGKVEEKEFEPSHAWDGPYQGGDFGFSQDPTAAIQCWIYQGDLYVSHEAFKKKLEIDDTAEFVEGKIPGWSNDVSRWDNARPESISYLKRHGMARAQSCDKWPGSVEDGIEHLKSYGKIYVHPRCPSISREFRLYSYKVDRNTEDITSKIVDDHNHGIDALRYAIGPMIKRRSQPRIRAL
jgi:phage terminase large subunit